MTIYLFRGVLAITEAEYEEIKKRSARGETQVEIAKAMQGLSARDVGDVLAGDVTEVRDG